MTPVIEAICGNRSAAQVLLHIETYGTGFGRAADTPTASPCRPFNGS